ncbi:uncharacterized protein ACNLHF_002679 isoform 2-T3 [Anomaloglossus baeobatrachus]|uniref:uncharacterized protein LOC142256376 isoform X2 n=1 Tax=Anomaloglossus baeobatrachus TaxID=238106 RepID=UPI003F4F94A4
MDLIQLMVVLLIFLVNLGLAMDYRSRDANWATQLADVFGSAGETAVQSPSMQCRELQVKLKSYLLKRTKTWWNKASLEQYLSKDITPRGLRVQVFPAFPVEDENFKERWEEACRMCSRTMIELLIGHDKKRLDELEKDIEMLNLEIKQKLSKESLAQFDIELEEEFKQWETDIKTKKARKFQRDLTDYRNNTVFKWYHERNGRRPVNHRSSNQSLAESVSSAESAGSSKISNREAHGQVPYRGGVETRNSYKTRHNQENWRKDGPHAKDTLKVINLTDKILTGAQLEVLQLGLSFSPVANFDLFTGIKDIQLFGRKLLLKKYFAKKDTGNLTGFSREEQEAIKILESLLAEQSSTDLTRFPSYTKKKSTTFPPLSACPTIELFVKMVVQEFRSLPSKRTHDNLSSHQRQALKELQLMKDIVIKQADKGGNVVIWSTKAYEQEAYKQLHDKACYTKLEGNPTTKFSIELLAILQKAYDEGIIPKSVFEGLIQEHPVTPTIYFLPKIHKSIEQPPGRPIVSGNNSLCEPICRFLDHYLKISVCTLPSYIRDSTEFLNRLEDLTMEADMVMVTADVQSLYTSIAHQDGLRAAEFYLRMTDMDQQLVDLLLLLLKFVLTHNYFLFKDRYYLQERGTAMGASCAPSYANLFLGWWERSIEFPSGPTGAVHMWLRFIDDVFMIWEGEIQQLKQFMDGLNNNRLNIGLTFNFSSESIEYLDVKVSKGCDGMLITDVHRKGTAVNSLLSARSSHPAQTIKAVPIGQFLRAKRICSTNTLFEHQANDLKRRFRSRHYREDSIHKGYTRAKETPRSQLLKTAIREQDHKGCVDWHKYQFINEYAQGHLRSSKDDLLMSFVALVFMYLHLSALL